MMPGDKALINYWKNYKNTNKNKSLWQPDFRGGRGKKKGGGQGEVKP